MLAEISINITAKVLQQTFSYIIPAGMKVRAGSRVLVPFGSRKEEGIVLSIHEDTEAATRTFTLKPILAVLSDQVGFREEMIQTALWISQYYLCSLADALRLFMIEKKGISQRTCVEAVPDAAALDGAEALVLDYVSRHSHVEKKTLEKHFAPDVLAGLYSRHALRDYLYQQNNVADKLETWLSFDHADTEGTLKRSPRQAELLQALAQSEPQPVSAWVQKGYSHDLIRHLCAHGFARLTEKPSRTVNFTHALAADTPWQLTEEQQAAVETIQRDQGGKTYLLHGVTGSGKTEIYMKLTADVLARGGQVLVLVPEIALTGQIVRRFVRRFGNDAVVMHSQLSKGERRNNWLRMANGESHICIGARSAVFTAFHNLGLIIVDEEHDSSYKQDDVPRYHTVEVARRRAAYYGCPVILGSATPSVGDYYKALQGEYVLITLRERVLHRPLPDVAVVDMREELARGNRNVLSDAMVALLTETLQKKQQAIILLNRRGFSTFVMCRKCGYVVKCNTCDVAMVYHKNQHRLRCHYCDAEKDVPLVCPSCGSKYIKFFGTGTEKVEEQLQLQFPQARIARLDQDTTARKNSGDRIIEAFRREEYDILLGTQMVAKGHDFANVSAVGILSADSLLNLPVYWAGERTFQLLTQAAGRAGRGDIPGKVVMQTYAPEHYVIQCAQKQDYQAFYEQEIAYRQELLYPPFHQLLKIVIVDENEKTLWDTGNTLALLLQTWKKESASDTAIIGPFVDIIKKVRNKYRIILLVKGKDLTEAKAFIREHAEFRRPGVLLDVDSAG